MANLTFKDFEVTSKLPHNYLYSDLHLDIEQEVILHPALSNTKATLGKDIKLDFDMAAIINSLNNLFNTMPGQRFLIPEYGLNLMQWLFIPVSEKYGNMIGSDIIDAVNRWEPRVSITKMLVNAKPEENEYDIAMAIYVPAFRQYTGLVGKLAPNGFSPLRTILR
jgi:phage baseplate assembly protein W